MDAFASHGTSDLRPLISVADIRCGRMINAVEFRKLLVSHRRMVRADRRPDRLRGLQDLDTGELFLTDERRLLEAGK